MEIMNTHKIAVAQMRIELGLPQINIDAGYGYIEKAAQEGCRLVLLPELWTSGFDLENKERYIDINREVITRLEELAGRHNLTIGGSYITREGDVFYNTFILVQPGERRHAQYHKIHLFTILGEAKHLQAGSSLTFTDTPIGRIGLAVCYDTRFPEIFRFYFRNQVDIVLVPAQWNNERTTHWRTLLRARAIENQVFMVASNPVGPLRDKILAGYSAIIDPWGEVLAEGDAAEQSLLVTEIDLSAKKTAEGKVPIRADSRDDLYSSWF